MLQDHHHLQQNGIQRNTRMSIQQMGPPPNQRTPIMMSMQAAGVFVSMPPGPTVITTQSLPQQPKPNMPPQVYHYENPPPVETEQNQTDQQQQQQCPNTNTSSGPNATLANIKEKTPMCLVNELARYNKIQHQYRLTGEQGPAHQKIFTVTLKLGNEEYEAEGPSIKKAQHSAAAQALTKTDFKHPPPKTIRNRPGNRNGNNTNGVTPTVELNALAMKRGERTIYVVENGTQQQTQQTHSTYITQPGYYPRHNIYNQQTQPRYNYDQRRNLRGGGGGGGGHYQYHDNRFYNQYRPNVPHQQQTDHCTVRLKVGEREYPGQGYTVQAARHDAASKAIEHIKQLGGIDQNEQQTTIQTNIQQENNGQIKLNNDVSRNSCGSGGVNGDITSDLKSPISLVYEIALKRNLNVTFEVLSEKGPPHMKVFVTQCRVGQFLAEGEGNGKKISKKRAAEKMLEELSKLPPIPNITNITQLKRKRVTNKKKTRNLIKVNMDKTTDLIEEINPISRLIQIQQANKEREPVYTVLEERGAPRRREFVIEASVNGYYCTGVGPNKKVAKRNAAEALLDKLGYLNTNQQPQQVQQQQNVTKSAIKTEKENNNESTNEKGRKVTFVEEKQETTQAPTTPVQSIGGSGGRQLVPGILLVNEQSTNFQNKTKETTTTSTSTGTSTTTDKSDKTTTNNQKPPTPIQGVRSKDQLLYLAQLMNIQVQFSDFPKANHEMYLTLVSLGTNPPQVCHGEGSSTEASHEKAALEALKVLSELGLDIVASPSKDNTSTNSADSGSSVNSKTGINQNGVKK